MKNYKKIILFLSCLVVPAMGICVSQQSHPCVLTDSNGKKVVQRLIEKETWANELFKKLSDRTDVYVNRGDGWLSDRLQMFWNTHSTKIFIRGEYFESAGGDKAPVPTVMYNGARSHATIYKRPKLEELAPRFEDSRGLLLTNSKDGKKEWASINKTGCMIASINNEIIGIARDAAFLWWVTNDEKYAKMAASVFDTYMMGMYYREVPLDLNYGHQQTLVGMSTFEVIHEDAIDALVPLYDFLFDYLKKQNREHLPYYEMAFKKWADNIIANGVPHNNWNLMQARFILKIGMILNDNSMYADAHGRQYYIDYIQNQSSIRQWSLKKLAEYGFDSNTGVWAECPGYSQVVLNDYSDLCSIFDSNFDIDLVKEMPVIDKAAKANFQYLFPDNMLMGFGDTHPSKINPNIYSRMLGNAQKNNRLDDVKVYTAILKLLNPDIDKSVENRQKPAISINSFFSGKPVNVDKKIKAADINTLVTPTFYAPNSSWVVQRNGMERNNSLMVALNGSLGNHMHANGISMELYGKGLRLAPDGGIGLTLYSGLDYSEYYSQFPAHNTVCVDGISSYPVMKSNHAFKLLNLFPTSNESCGYQTVTYSNIYFLEPESMSDQLRLVSLISVGDDKGYYIDIFRSHKREGGDKMHDYFYHNMGQTMDVAASDGKKLDLLPTQELAFAGAHIGAYSYIYNKEAALTNSDINTLFTVNSGDNNIYMKMWMRGDEGRKIFKALSPMTEGLSRMPGMPYDIKNQPTLTFVARQYGEAWNHPFVSVFEPYSAKEPGVVEAVNYPKVSGNASAVALEVVLKDGRNDMILSSDNESVETSLSNGVRMKAVYSFCRNKGNDKEIIMLGGGTLLHIGEMTISADAPVDVLLKKTSSGWSCKSSGICAIVLGNKKYNVNRGETNL